MCILFSSRMDAQQDPSEKAVHPTVEFGYGLGGQFYLNYLEYNPSLSILGGIVHHKSVKSHLSILTGYEKLNEEAFLPIMVRYAYGSKGRFFIHAGYALGFWSDLDDFEEYNYTGGPLAGLGYVHPVFDRQDFKIFLSTAYDFRASTLSFQTSSQSTKIINHLQHHFLSVKLHFEI